MATLGAVASRLPLYRCAQGSCAAQGHDTGVAERDGLEARAGLLSGSAPGSRRAETALKVLTASVQDSVSAVIKHEVGSSYAGVTKQPRATGQEGADRKLPAASGRTISSGFVNV